MKSASRFARLLGTLLAGVSPAEGLISTSDR
jgi:hypothetical protein